MSNVNLCSDVRVVSSSLWKQREDIFKCKKDRFVVLYIKGVNSYGSSFLVEDFPDVESSIVSSS